MEQVHLPAEPPVVALLRLLQLVQVGLQLLLVAPCGAVDALEHGVAVIAAPIGAGDLHQLEALADPAGGRHVRATAQVEPFALAVDGDVLRSGQVADQLGLVLLAPVLEEADRLVAVPDFAHEAGIAGDDLAHLRLDLFQIVGRERLGPREVVIEAVGDRRADRDLRAGIERLDGFRHHMGRIVTDQAERYPRGRG